MRFARQGDSLTVRTPAKLNLTLQVLGKRPDGFHDLRTLMVSVGLFDTLRFSPSSNPDLALRAVDAGRFPSDVPLDDRNLVLRAARLLRESHGVREGVEIALIKRIPSQAGMGGGSSDAAATLVALNRFWRLDLPMEELHRLAAELGSDVNFFLESPVAAVCTGRGERIEPIAIRRPLFFVIVKPPSGLSTAEVFRSLLIPEGVSRLCRQIPAPSLERASFAELSGLLMNDLESAGRRLNPDVDRILQGLDRFGVAAVMTGSGSACFGLCRTARQARHLSARCRAVGWKEVFAVAAAV